MEYNHFFFRVHLCVCAHKLGPTHEEPSLTAKLNCKQQEEQDEEVKPAPGARAGKIELGIGRWCSGKARKSRESRGRMPGKPGGKAGHVVWRSSLAFCITFD